MERSEVEKIYNLANLSLDGKDVDDISNKFNTVLEFIGDIFDVDTEGVEFTEMISNHKAVFREDEVGQSVARDEALKNAAETEFGYFRLDFKL